MDKKEYNIAWRRNNPEKQKAIAQRYREKHREQIRKYARDWCHNNLHKGNEWSKIWRTNNPERFKEIQKRYCSKPEVKERKSEWQKEWIKNNPGKVKEIRKRYYNKLRQLHPLKNAGWGNGWNLIRLKILKRDNYRCQICGRKGTEVHHSDGAGSNIPVNKQNNKPDNLLTVCHKCHLNLDLLLRNGTFGKGKWKRDEERDKIIIKMLSDKSQSEIARTFDLSRQRINQIVKRCG